MFSVLVAGLSGLVWGVGDFAGSKASQRASAFSVTWLSKVASLPLLAVYIAATYVNPQLPTLAWGALAGACGNVGLIVFYQAMARGSMTVVAPIAAVTSAGLPVVLGLLMGERPGLLRLVGIALAVLAIGLVSSMSTPAPAPEPRTAPVAAETGSRAAGPRTSAAPGPGQPASPASPTGSGAKRPRVSSVESRLIAAAVLSGACFAAFFACLRQAGQVADGDPGLWPNAASQATAILLTGLLLLWRRPALPHGAALRWTLIAGPIDMTANVLYLIAARQGELSLVAPLAALYPVSTVLLAVALDGERLRRIQVAGLLLAVLALVLVSR